MVAEVGLEVLFKRSHAVLVDAGKSFQEQMHRSDDWQWESKAGDALLAIEPPDVIHLYRPLPYEVVKEGPDSQVVHDIVEKASQRLHI